MANSNLHVMRFFRMYLEDDVPDHLVLSRFRTRLTVTHACDGVLERVNQQIRTHGIMVTRGYHVDASITQSPRKPKIRSFYEVVNDREEQDDESDAKAAMRVIERSTRCRCPSVLG